MENVRPSISELRYQTEKFDTQHWDLQLTKELKPIRDRIGALEDAVSDIRAQSETFLRQEFPSGLNRSMGPS